MTSVRNTLAIVHDVHGEPSNVLRPLSTPIANGAPPARHAIVRLHKTPIHPGDIHIIRAASNGGPPMPIDPRHPRIPGFEGVGIVDSLGADLKAEGRFAEGQRVVFFTAHGAWAERVLVAGDTMLAVPHEIPDGVAAQALINGITAQIVLKAGHNALRPGHAMPVHFLQTAAASAVGRLITRLALDIGLVPLRLVRTADKAKALEKSLPGSPVIATESPGWQREVRAALNGRPLDVVIDSIGGSFIDEIASVMEDGTALVNFGWLGKGKADLSSFAPRQLSFRGVSILYWLLNTPAEEKAAVAVKALALAAKHPELYPVEAEYPLVQFPKAIRHAVGKKDGAILLTA